jgi:ATP-dependent Lon protease
MRHWRLKEKLLAAGRSGIKTVLIPEGECQRLAEIPTRSRNRLAIIALMLTWVEQVLDCAAL